MVTSRILNRRRHGGAPAQGVQNGRRRSRSRTGAGSGLRSHALHPAAAYQRLRLSDFGRVYAVAGVLLLMAICYLIVAAQMTQTSYEMNRLRAQQAELVAEQGQLRYQGVQLHTPARVAQAAGLAGLAPASTPVKYLGYQPVAIDLGASTGETPPDRTALWQRAVAGLLTGVGASREVQAADR